MMDNARWKMQALTAIVAILLAFSAATPGGEQGRPLTVAGRLQYDKDVSAMTPLGRFLVVAVDEGRSLQLLEPVGDDADAWRVREAVIHLLEEDVEADLEALTTDGEWVYAAGSHSLKRRKVDSKRSYQANLKRLGEVVHEPSRDYVFRVQLDPSTGEPRGPVERVGLRELIRADPWLGRFTRIPGKENGIDVEGLAFDGKRLLLGFRSPVLRQGQVPVLVLDFARPSRYELRFVDLDGRGIRALARVEQGFLIVAAAETGSRSDLVLWDGVSCVPAADRPPCKTRVVTRLPGVDEAGLEGLAVVRETASRWELLLVYDGASNGSPTRLEVAK